MNETDKLIAAIFAATMTSKQPAPGPREFFGFYDACLAEMLEREVLATAVKVEKTLAAQNKAWADAGPPSK